jgi:hypothetical protein
MSRAMRAFHARKPAKHAPKGTDIGGQFIGPKSIARTLLKLFGSKVDPADRPGADKPGSRALAKVVPGVARGSGRSVGRAMGTQLRPGRRPSPQIDERYGTARIPTAGGGSVSIRPVSRPARADDRVIDPRNPRRMGTVVAVNTRPLDTRYTNPRDTEPAPGVGQLHPASMRVRWDDGEVETRPIASVSDAVRDPKRYFGAQRGTPRPKADAPSGPARADTAAERMARMVADGAVVGRDRQRALDVVRRASGGDVPSRPKSREDVLDMVGRGEISHDDAVAMLAHHEGSGGSPSPDELDDMVTGALEHLARENGVVTGAGYPPRESDRDTILAKLRAAGIRAPQEGAPPAAAVFAPNAEHQRILKAATSAGGLRKREGMSPSGARVNGHVDDLVRFGHLERVRGSDHYSLTDRGREALGSPSPVSPAKVAPAPAKVAKKAAAKVAGAKAAAPATAAATSAHMQTATTREEAHAALADLSLVELKDVAKQTGTSTAGAPTKERLRTQIVEHTVGFRLNSATIRGGTWADTGAPGGAVRPAGSTAVAKVTRGRATAPKATPAATERTKLANSLGRRYTQGESIADIAASEGRSESWVHKLLTDHGFQLRPRGGQSSARKATQSKAVAKVAAAKAATPKPLNATTYDALSTFFYGGERELPVGFLSRARAERLEGLGLIRTEGGAQRVTPEGRRAFAERAPATFDAATLADELAQAMPDRATLATRLAGLNKQQLSKLAHAHHVDLPPRTSDRYKAMSVDQLREFLISELDNAYRHPRWVWR